jgi:hypothetical protein
MVRWLVTQVPRANLFVAIEEFVDHAANPAEQHFVLLSKRPRFDL